jgi:DNA-binding transcriptional regulator YhcF (GntR family)/predicted hydrocarbon binding protein
MNKTDTAYKEIKNRLFEEYWKPGEKITSERDLATLLHVSRVTIKAAINRLIDEGYLGYIEGKKGTFVTNVQNIKDGTRTICVAIDNKTPAFSSYLLEGIHNTLLNKGYHTLYFNTLFNKENIFEQIKNLLNDDIAGVIFAPLMGDFNVENNFKIINLLKNNNIPLIQVDRYVTEDYGSYVGTNNTKAFYKLTKEIIKKGYKSILVASGYSTSSANEKIVGIKKALNEHNREYKEININETDFVLSNKLSIDDDMINEIESSDAILTFNQNIARAIKKINDTKYIASSSASKEECENNIAAVHQMYEIGKDCGKLIIEAIEENNDIQKTIFINAPIYEKQ